MALQKALALDRVAVCDHIRNEIVRILTKKLHWELKRATQDLTVYFEKATWVPISGKIRGVCRDPDDDAIIECAVNSNAELIISGDKDLLALKQYNQIRIITPREYLAPPANGKRL